jgi:hypothetical protein
MIIKSVAVKMERQLDVRIRKVVKPQVLYIRFEGT